MYEKDEKAQRKRGPAKVWDLRITLPISIAIGDRIDALRHEDEDRVTFIRAAIEAELAKPERANKRQQ